MTDSTSHTLEAAPWDRSRNPLFDTMFVTQGFDLGSLGFQGLRVEPLETGWRSAS